MSSMALTAGVDVGKTYLDLGFHPAGEPVRRTNDARGIARPVDLAKERGATRAAGMDPGRARTHVRGHEAWSASGGRSMTERRVLLLVGGIAAAVVIGLSALIFAVTGSSNDMRRIGGPFAMEDMTGHPVTEADLRGRPTALFFGFTRCPASCPVTLQVLTNVLGRMGPSADRVNVVFVTVDPERDTPEAMRAYLGSFDPRIRGFVGTDAQVAAMADAFKVRYRKVPLDGGDYTMDHTAAVILLDARGRFAGTVTSDDDEKAIEARLEGLVQAASRTVGGTAAAGG